MARDNEYFIHDTAIVEEGVTVCAGAKIWHHSHVRRGAHIGEGVSLGKDVYVDADVRIGRGARIQNGVSVFSGVTLEPWVFLGPHVVFTNDTRPRAGSLSWSVVPTVLKSGSAVGAGSTIVCGVTIGEYAMIGAGAVVTTDISPFTLAFGLPAVARRRICVCGKTAMADDASFSQLLKSCCRESLQPEMLENAEQVMEELARRSNENG